MTEQMHKAAIISPCGQYRYTLSRIWDPTLPILAWCLLNPSTADAMVDDATVRRCIGFARLWGYGGIFIVNMFAFRSRYPKQLRIVDDPVGPENDNYILDTVARFDTVVGWGGNGDSYPDRVRSVTELLEQCYNRRPMCLGTTRTGQPKHPLFIPYSASRVAWSLPTEIRDGW